MMTPDCQPTRDGGVLCSDLLDRHLYHSQDGIRIFCGDNRELAPMLGNYDLLLTDPPYGVDVQECYRVSKRGKSGSLGVTTNRGGKQWQGNVPTIEELQAMIAKAERAIIWGANYYPMPPSKCWLVWDKEQTGEFAHCELAWTNLTKTVRYFRYMWKGMFQGNMAEKEIRYHPTQKPVPVMEWAIGLTTAQTILDPWAGSGSTLIAARAKGLKADGIEINEQYCEAAKQRLSQGVLLAV